MIRLRSYIMIGLLGLLLSACNASTTPSSQDGSKTPVIGKEVAQSSPSTSPPPASPRSVSKGDVVYLDVKGGRIEIELRRDIAPGHAERITTLVNQGFYDGVVFHRVIGGFMAQTGDPTGTGRGGSDLPDLKAEFSSEPFVRGTLGMARSNNPNSANSQFFIMFAPGDFLNGKYTVFGRVTKGMEFVDALKKGAAGSGVVTDPDKIIKMQMAPSS